MIYLHRGKHGVPCKTTAGTAEGRRCNESTFEAKILHRILQSELISQTVSVGGRDGTTGWNTVPSINVMVLAGPL